MMLLEEMSWPEIEAGLKKTTTVILPLGATEEHGPHLPVFTDTIQAIEVAKRVAETRGIFVAPHLHYGVCRSTRGFPGTLSVGHDALRSYMYDILLSLYDSGFRKIMLLTGHAGGQHLSALEQACQKAAANREFLISLVSLYDLIDPKAVEAKDDGHAGEIETSMIMAIRPDLAKGKPAANFPCRPRFLVLKDVRHLMGSGVMGDPSQASPEKGKQFFDMMVEGVLKALEELEMHQVHQ